MTIKELSNSIGLPLTSETVTVEREAFARYATRTVEAGAPLAFMYATDERSKFAVSAVFSLKGSGFLTLRTELDREDPTYPSLTATIMAAHWFERLIHDQFGIVAIGHPDWRRLIHHENIPADTYPLRKEFAWNTALAHANEQYPMHHVAGQGIYEIPVGPIHAGIIEPGHFRFNVRGERIITLEGKLFFTHKGVEKLLEGKMPEEAMPFIERISGDMVVGHTLAYVQAVERATGTSVSLRAEGLRVLWSELERISAHIFDMGNMGGNGTGFTFMAAQGFRLVEEMRRMYAALLGHRFLRGAITVAGAHDISDADSRLIIDTLQRIEREMEEVIAIALATDGLKERFETTGVLSKIAAEAYGARGVPARASGVMSDLRQDHPYAAYGAHAPRMISRADGDVAARFAVRIEEFRESLRLIRAVLSSLPKGSAQGTLAKQSGEALGWAESFRGAVIDFVRIDWTGAIERCAISDPSFCNWALFGEIGPGNIVPDFPLCNKSLNLSYSGNDL
jgi:Ni,Fe-hydrogenase III large subunit/Ni,Fe-hydrogenase III component G